MFLRTARYRRYGERRLLDRYLSECDAAISLHKLVDFGNGYAFNSGTYSDDGNYKVQTIKNVRDGNVDCSDANRIVNIPGRIKSYCRLMLGDIVLSLMGSVGRVGIVAEPDCLLNHRVAVLVSVRKDTLTGFFSGSGKLPLRNI